MPTFVQPPYWFRGPGEPTLQNVNREHNMHRGRLLSLRTQFIGLLRHGHGRSSAEVFVDMELAEVTRSFEAFKQHWHEANPK